VSSTAVIGLQWGDEAKGKIVDLLTDQHDVVVRYQGGNNAGHTVVCNGETYKLSLLPVGLLRPGIVSVIATGVVVNPQALLGEIGQLRARNISVGENLLISDRAHVIFPWHVAEEAILEDSRGDNAIGTTRRGIGTCYRDKAGRTHAIRMGDLYHTGTFAARLSDIVQQKNAMLRALAPDLQPLDAAKIADEYLGYAHALQVHVTDTTAFLHKALAAGKRLLFEGAQGSLLDLDHGTFPFVTSSSSSGCGIHSGSGVPERNISRMIGVVKAYTTRVGGGPFPTELTDAIGQHIRDVGREYGTVTGRPRRCGWFDAVAAGYGARISGVDSLSVMLLDVLSQLEEINVCTAYEIGGERTTDFPSHVEELAQARPVYRTLPGWKSDISHARRLADFPKPARAYLDTMNELIGKPVEIVSIGPDRGQTIFCEKR
jgi:adenylosuccinate synthase